MYKIDARGLACPEPVLLTKKALSNKDTTIEILVDNSTAQQNITRFATNQGCTVTSSPVGEDYLISVVK